MDRWPNLSYRSNFITGISTFAIFFYFQHCIASLKFCDYLFGSFFACTPSLLVKFAYLGVVDCKVPVDFLSISFAFISNKCLCCFKSEGFLITVLELDIFRVLSLLQIEVVEDSLLFWA